MALNNNTIMSWLNAITEYTLQLIKELRNNSYQGKIFVSVRNEKNTGMFNKYSVDGILSPYENGSLKLL